MYCSGSFEQTICCVVTNATKADSTHHTNLAYLVLHVQEYVVLFIPGAENKLPTPNRWKDYDDVCTWRQKS